MKRCIVCNRSNTGKNKGLLFVTAKCVDCESGIVIKREVFGKPGRNKKVKVKKIVKRDNIRKCPRCGDKRNVYGNGVIETYCKECKLVVNKINRIKNKLSGIKGLLSRLFHSDDKFNSI